MLDVAVIGAGQAGLAAGYWLKRAGLSFTILERRAAPGGSWASYYDSLTLFSPARYSDLPGMRFPGRRSRYPKRDEVTAYLTAYAARFALPVRTNAEVAEVRRLPNGFELVLRDGHHMTARTVIAATGSFDTPLLPEIPGAPDFAGQALHSRAYASPQAFVGKRVVVVGAGNSAVQIAVELSEAGAETTLATREPIRFRKQTLLGLDVHFWLKVAGLDRKPLGQLGGAVLDRGRYERAVSAGRPDRKAMFRRFTTRGVEWADGKVEPVDAVIFATGFLPSLAPLAGLDVIDAQGAFRHEAGASTTTPGLFFLGFQGLNSLRSATLRGAGPEARQVVERVRRFCAAATPSGRRDLGLARDVRAAEQGA